MRASLIAIVLVASTRAGLAQVPPAAPTPPVQGQAAPGRDMTTDMEAMLRKAGFTDLQIMANSVFVRGKDKAGNPVAMILNPHSMTEMVILDPHTGTAAGGNGTAAPLTGSGTFATILPTEKLATALIGLVVQNAAGDKIGTIKDIAIDHGGVQAYIIGVGGFLGIGDRYVAVTPRAMSLTYDGATKTYRATTSATVEQLKAAPAFTFKEFEDAKRD